MGCGRREDARGLRVLGGIRRPPRVLGALRRLCAQQMAPGDEQIGEGAGHQQPVRVLVEPAIAHLGKAEDPLDDPDRMLDPRLRRGRLLARTFDLVRFLARSARSTMPRWR